MPGVEKLHLAEAFEDSPQTRNLLGVFEKDARLLSNYIQHFNKCCTRIINAQREMTAATQSLSAHLKSYDQQRFPLESEDSILSATLGQFSLYLDELSTVHQILSTQMADNMMFPLSRFIQADIDEINTVGEMYKISSNDLEESLSKYMKLSKKKDNEKLRHETSEDVFQMRKKFHQTSMHYYSALNALQYKRKTALLEPLVGLFYGEKAFFEMGRESTSKTELDGFLSTTTASVQGVKLELNEDTKKTVELIDAIEQNSMHLYHTEPSPDLPYIPPNPTLNQKGGYLFIRSKQNILNTKWERCYFFIQAGNLMSQAKGEFAGSLVVDLNDDGVISEPIECDDRKNVFHVVIPKSRKSIILQAENSVEKEEWISTINNAARESGYVKGKGPNLPASKQPIRPDSFSKTSQSSRDSNVSFDAPIQFDIITPSDEDRMIMQATKDGPPKRINPFDQGSHDIIGHNVTDDNSFSQMFVVRFLGSMEVKTDRGEHLILETMRQIMAARAIHNIFKTTESHLVVSSAILRLLDPSNNSIRTMFSLEDISFWAAHNENKRLFGFIARQKAASEKDKSSFACYVFECNTNAEEICHSISTATKLAYQALMQEKVNQDKKLETNLLLANIGQLDDLDEEDGEKPLPPLSDMSHEELRHLEDTLGLPLSADGKDVVLDPSVEQLVSEKLSDKAQSVVTTTDQVVTATDQVVTTTESASNLDKDEVDSESEA